MGTPLEEIQLMDTVPHTDIVKALRSGREFRWSDSWDYRDTLNQIEFRTTTKPPTEDGSFSFQSLDLRPTRNLTVYKITMKRF